MTSLPPRALGSAGRPAPGASSLTAPPRGGGPIGAVTKAVKHAVAYAESHTGVPAIVVAAIVLVVGFRLFKRSLRFALEVALVVGLLGAASLLGWVRF